MSGSTFRLCIPFNVQRCKAQLDPSGTESSGAVNGMFTIEQISTTPVLTAGDGAVQFKARTIILIPTGSVVVNLESDIFSNGNGNVFRLSKSKICYCSLSNGNSLISSKENIACSVGKIDGISNFHIGMEFHGGIAAVSVDHIGKIFYIAGSVETDDGTVSIDGSLFCIFPFSTDLDNVSILIGQVEVVVEDKVVVVPYIIQQDFVVCFSHSGIAGVVQQFVGAVCHVSVVHIRSGIADGDGSAHVLDTFDRNFKSGHDRGELDGGFNIHSDIGPLGESDLTGTEKRLIIHRDFAGDFHIGSGFN